MIKIIYNILKRVVLSFIMIYTFDLILKGFNVIIPINYYTIGIVTLLGIPGLLLLSLSFFFLL